MTTNERFSGLHSLRDRPRVRLSGLLTWAAATAPLAYRAAIQPELLAGSPRVPIALAAALLFAACWLHRLGREPWLSLLQVALAVTAFAAEPFPMPSAPTLVLLAVIVVPRLVLAGWPRLAVGAIVLQSAALGFVYAGAMGSVVGLIAFVGSLAGLMVFAYAAARIVTAEVRAVAALAATQSLLATGVRLGERVRIARDLHDSVGHHLTTLSLHLDLARRQPSEDARRTLDTAHAVCRLLLTEIRDVVRDVRHTDAHELAVALRGMAEHVPGLDVDVRIDAELGGVDSERAQTLLRCAQEALTNALRHAGARSFSLSLSREGDRLALVAEDDGRGFDARRPGGGLDGLEERLQRLGGGLAIGSRDGASGTRVVASVTVLAEAS